MMIKLMLSTCFLFYVVSVQAAEPPRQSLKAAERFVRDNDKDGDGKLTRDEFPQRARGFFSRIDSNKDGKVSVEEDAAFRASRSAKPITNRPSPSKEGVKVLKDLVYSRVGERELPLDLYLPEEVKGPLPVVVWIHGGGWRGGSKGNAGPARPLVGRGYAVVDVEYRLSGEARFPAQVEDCKAAIRWIRANADKYGLDPGKIAAWGSSAGGHLVAFLGTSAGVKEFETETDSEFSSSVDLVIDWFGPTDLLQMNKQAVEGARMDHDAANSPESLLVGGPIQEEPYRNVAVKANPITYVDGNEPPFLLVHGDRDLSVSHRQSILLHEALKAVGVDSTLQIVKGGSHGFREGEKTAEEERGKALEQEALALKTLASSRIALAERELLAGNVREAELLLQQVPDSSRNSNWEFIDRHLYQEEERYDSWSSEMGGYIEMSSDGNRIFYERGGNRGYAMAELKGAMSWRPITRNEKIKPGIMSLGNKDEWLLYVSQSDEIVVVDWVRNKELFRRKYEGPILTRVALSPSGSQYVLASNQGQRVATHSTESGELLWEAKGREPIAFSPDGELVGFREDGTGFDINVRIHESASGKRSFSIGAPNLGSYGGQKNKAMKNWLLIDRKGSRIQLLSENFLYNWIPSNRRNLPLSRGKPKALSPDGRLLVSTEGNRVYLLDARRNELIREWSVMELGNWGIGRIRFSNEGQRILFLSPDRGLGSWDTGWRVPLFDGLGYAGPDGGGVDGTRKISLSFSNDGQYLLYSDLLKVHRWNLSDGLVSQIFEVSRKEKGYSNLNGLVLLPRTGRIALSIRGREEMQLVSEDTFEVVEEIREKSLAPLASQLSFSKNEDVFLVVQYRWNDKEQVGGQPLVSVYSTEGASLLFETAWKKGEANSLAAFCHDDQWIVAGGVVDGMKNMGLEFWDWRKNERVRQLFPEQTGSIVSMHVSGDGSRIATGTHKGWIRIWDVESGAMAVEFRAHWKAVSSILYSPDVNDVITGGHDGSVRIHDAATGEEKRVFYGHADPVNSLAISPDGRLVASSSWFGNRGSIKVWRITDGYVPRKGGRPEIIRLTREDIE